MGKNMGTVDRVARGFVIAPAAIAAAFAVGAGGVAGIVLLAAAAVMLATAAVGFCPLYAMLGIDTRGHRRRLTHG